jgi:hypothetical protein
MNVPNSSLLHTSRVVHLLRASRCCSRVGCLIVGFASQAIWMGTATANHIGNPANDINDVRNSLGPGEGYLNFSTAGHGEEYTGHTDVTGRDFADNWITIRPIRLTDSAGVPPMQATVEFVDQDFDFMRKIYAQAGIGIRKLATVEQALPVTWANFDEAEQIKVGNMFDNTNGAINLFYARSLAGTTANGISAGPEFVGATLSGQQVTRPHSFVRDGRDFNTSAHEIGHQLLNGNALWMEDATPSESADITNLMFRTNAGSSKDLDDIGQMLSATVGGHDIIEHRVDATTMGVQISRIHQNGGPRRVPPPMPEPAGYPPAVPDFVYHANYHNTHGDRADFDWVTDQRLIETIAGGGNGADHNAGVDFLQWEINPGAVASSTHTGPSADNHLHGGLGELPLGTFQGDFFKIVDIISNINLYADNDINTTTGAVSDRSKALDYHIPDFSVNGTDWFPGTLVSVFQQGWTPVSNIENYITRWRTDLDAKFLRIASVGAGVVGHDGNTQIDAIIARVPEPCGFVLALVALLGATSASRRPRNLSSRPTRGLCKCKH